jgi:hypothetical protein
LGAFFEQAKVIDPVLIESIVPDRISIIVVKQSRAKITNPSDISPVVSAIAEA